MSEALARRYRLFLHAYPAAYRQQRGDDLLGTLLDGAQPRQTVPNPGEVVSILVEGTRVRLGLVPKPSSRQVWADGLRLALLPLLGSACSSAVLDVADRGLTGRTGFAAIIAALLAFVAVLRDRPRAALLLVLAWQVVVLRTGPVSWQLLTAAAVLAILAFWLRPVRQPRSVTWLLVPAATMALLLAPTFEAGRATYTYPYLQLITVILIAAAAVGAFVDARVPIIAGCFVAAEMLADTVSVPLHGDTTITTDLHTAAITLSTWGLITILAAAALFLIGQMAALRAARV